MSEADAIVFVVDDDPGIRDSLASLLRSVGLAVEKGPGYYKVIEAAKAKSGALPVYGFDGKPAQSPPKRAKE